MFGCRTVVWLSSLLLLVRSRGAKPSVASWPACQRPVRALLGVRVSKETRRIHRSNAPPLSCDSAWYKRAPSTSAPELRRVQDSWSQDLRAVGKQVGSMRAGSKKTLLARPRENEKKCKNKSLLNAYFFLLKTFSNTVLVMGGALLKTKSFLVKICKRVFWT